MMMDVRAPGMGLPSPKGDRLFFSWNVTGTKQVWRLDGPDRFPVQLTGGEDNTSVVEVTPDGKTLVVQRDRKGEENPGLYLLDAAGGPLVALQHREKVQTHFQFLTEDGRWLYFRANDQKPDSYVLYRWDLKTNKKEKVLDEPGLWAIDDHRPDGRLLLRKDVGSMQAEYFELAPGAATPTPLFGQGEKIEYEAQYAAASGEVLVLTNKLSDFRRLYRWKEGKFEPVTPELKWDVYGFAIDQARSRILTMTNEGGYLRLGALDARTYKPLALPKLPAADHVVFGYTTRDGRYSTLGVETSQSPRTSYVYDWQKKSLVRWVVPSAPEVDTSKFAVPTLESYPARDGTPIPMFVRRPSSCPGQAPCPVVVEFHGGPESQAMAGFNPYAQLFVDRGFVFVQPNVRGSDGYGKKWLDADNGAKRLEVITDIEDCAKFIREKWGKDGKAPKIAATGGSYGGYSTLMAMTRFAGAYDAGVSNVGISSLLTFLNNTAPYRRILRISEYGDPEKDQAVLKQLSPVTYVEKTSAPLLLIQGLTDPRVPAGEAIQIRDSVARRNVPVELIIFADEGHGAQKRENRVQTLGQTLLFLEKHLQ
ncbi:MAG: prolyl oligopeptidase family serine peptidase [Myxococcales bacterium]